jgi:hypothetical protein
MLAEVDQVGNSTAENELHRTVPSRVIYRMHKVIQISDFRMRCLLLAACIFARNMS